MNYILSFWKRAPWFVRGFAIGNIAMDFFVFGWWWGLIGIYAWAFVVPSTIYLLERREKK